MGSSCRRFLNASVSDSLVTIASVVVGCFGGEAAMDGRGWHILAVVKTRRANADASVDFGGVLVSVYVSLAVDTDASSCRCEISFLTENALMQFQRMHKTQDTSSR